jgi:hypothetical protein
LGLARRASQSSRPSTRSGANGFPVITQAWLNAWEYVIPFLSLPPEVRRVIYTTRAIEALTRQLGKAIKTKGHFPNEDAARQADLPRAPRCRPAMDKNPELDDRPARVRNSLRRRLPDTAS